MIFEETHSNRIRDLLASAYPQYEAIRRIIIETEPDFQISRIKYLLSQPSWAYAVHPSLIINKDDSKGKIERAQSIFDKFIKTNLVAKKFLDFGCGEGHCTAIAAHKGAKSVGYDLYPTWSEDIVQTRMAFTDNWDKVIDHAPFDVVLIYDVIDHSEYEHPIEILKKIKNVLSPDGVIYLTCHPWCSRHGNHSYLSQNKAFIHLFLSEEELQEMRWQGIYTRKTIHPIQTYADWISKSNLEIKDIDVRRFPGGVESLFRTEPILLSMIAEHWKSSYEYELSEGTKFPLEQLEQEFHHYELTHQLSDENL